MASWPGAIIQCSLPSQLVVASRHGMGIEHHGVWCLVCWFIEAWRGQLKGINYYEIQSDEVIG